MYKSSVRIYDRNPWAFFILFISLLISSVLFEHRMYIDFDDYFSRYPRLHSHHTNNDFLARILEGFFSQKAKSTCEMFANNQIIPLFKKKVKTRKSFKFGRVFFQIQFVLEEICLDFEWTWRITLIKFLAIYYLFFVLRLFLVISINLVIFSFV